MPARRASGERKLDAALAALKRALGGLGKPWMIIGGIAIVARGVRRMTTDIDAVIRGDEVEPEAVLEALGSQQIEPRIPDALEFARRTLVLLVRHAPTGVDLDLSFGWSSFEMDALTKCTNAAFGRVTVPMATAEDLVIFKAIAGRPKDLDDAETLLLLHESIDLRRVRSVVAEMALLAEAEHMPKQLETVIARAGRW